MAFPTALELEFREPLVALLRLQIDPSGLRMRARVTHLKYLARPINSARFSFSSNKH